jgi:hypothetical protein
MDGGNEKRVAIKFCFKAGLSATETLVLVQKAYGNEALNRSNVFRWYSGFRNRRELVEDDERCGRPKSTRTEVSITACWFGKKKWPSNRIKNDSRIFEHPQDSSSSDSGIVIGKEKVLRTFCSTLLDTWAERRSSHILPRHYHNGRCRQKFFLTKLLREMRPDVLSMTPKQSDRVLNELVRHPVGRRNWNSKGPTLRPCW